MSPHPGISCHTIMTDDKYTSRTENVGQFRCETTYARSEEKTFTDLSASYGGREKYPTPGMLLGATLSSCMMSLLSVIAARKEVDLRGMRILAHAVESEKGIEKIELKAVMPLDGQPSAALHAGKSRHDLSGPPGAASGSGNPHRMGMEEIGISLAPGRPAQPAL